MPHEDFYKCCSSFLDPPSLHLPTFIYVSAQLLLQVNLPQTQLPVYISLSSLKFYQFTYLLCDYVITVCCTLNILSSKSTGTLFISLTINFPRERSGIKIFMSERTSFPISYRIKFQITYPILQSLAQSGSSSSLRNMTSDIYIFTQFLSVLTMTN